MPQFAKLGYRRACCRVKGRHLDSFEGNTRPDKTSQSIVSDWKATERKAITMVARPPVSQKIRDDVAKQHKLASKNGYKPIV